MSDYVHLCLSGLLDQDLTSQEYFNSLPSRVRQTLLAEDEVRTFAELQERAAYLKKAGGQPPV